eukprot:scaffold294_cov131-Isochrysis_galbana.AAC.2
MSCAPPAPSRVLLEQLDRALQVQRVKRAEGRHAAVPLAVGERRLAPALFARLALGPPHAPLSSAPPSGISGTSLATASTKRERTARCDPPAACERWYRPLICCDGSGATRPAAQQHAPNSIPNVGGTRSARAPECRFHMYKILRWAQKTYIAHRVTRRGLTSVRQVRNEL